MNRRASIEEGQGVFVECMKNKLHPDEAQDHCKSVVEEDKLFEKAIDKEEELSKPQQCKSIACKDQILLLSEAKDRRNRVERKHQIRGSKRQNDKEQGGDGCMTIMAIEEAVSDVSIGHRKNASNEADKSILLNFPNFFLFTGNAFAGL